MTNNPTEATATILLLMLLTGLICATPGTVALWRSKANRLSLKSAQQLEQELETRLERMHTRILTLEAEGAEKDKRIDAIQLQSDQQQTRIVTLERQNTGLVLMVKRLIAQAERHELKPDVTLHELNSLLS